jgi:three-Cys-motif partner protein
VRTEEKVPQRQSADVDRIGSWSEDKLFLVQQYLPAYSIIMSKQKEKGWLKAYHYVDAFAGSVRPIARSNDPDVIRFVDGSPLRALGIEPPFDVYWFIDQSATRSRKLKNLQNEFPMKNIQVRRGDCNVILRKEVIPTISRKSKQRGLVFLDPYGLQIEWATIEALGKAGTLDIFVNFSLMGLTRLLRRDQPPDKNTREEISRIMGNTEWIDELYSPTPLSQLWGGEPQLKREVVRAEWLAHLYAKQVGQLFTYVSTPGIMRNSRNSALYSLFLASHRAVAVKIADDIYQRYQRTRKPQISVRAAPKSEQQSTFFDSLNETQRD